MTIRAALEKPVKSGDRITVVLPEGFVIPKKVEANSITVDRKYCKGNVISENTELKFRSPVTTNNLAILNISNKCKIQNPQAGTYKVKLTVNEKIIDCGQIEIIKRTEK